MAKGTCSIHADTATLDGWAKQIGWFSGFTQDIFKTLLSRLPVPEFGQVQPKADYLIADWYNPDW